MCKCRSVISAALSAAVLLVEAGCQQAQDAKNTYSAVVASTKAIKEIGTHMEAAELRQQQRREHGDTLAISYKDLQQYLPASPAGYTAAGAPDGQNMKAGQIHYSSAAQEYRKGDQTLKIALLDYNAAAPLLAASTAMMDASLAIEDDSQLMRSPNLGQQGVKAIETLDKKSHKATVVLGVADRFLVTVEASGQNDPQLVEDVAKSLPLKKLAEL